MPSFRKRGNKWRVEIYYHGKRFSKTFPSKVECEKWSYIKLYELNHGKHLTTKHKTLRDALERYLEEETPKKLSANNESYVINQFLKLPIADRFLEDLTTSDFANWRDERLQKVKPSTVIREASVFKAMYRIAVNEWQWVRFSPLTHLTLPPKPPSRERRITDTEQKSLLTVFDYNEIKPPQRNTDYVALVFLFALETAMRSGEILSLTWDNVYLDERYVHIVKSKNGSKRSVSLSQKAVKILQVLPKKFKTCFKVNSEQRKNIFRDYCKKAGIENLRFHDTRHEALTRLAQKLHILDLARMAGVKDVQTLMVYYNATATEIAKKLD